MSGFVEGVDRSQSSLFPAHLEDYVAEDNPVRAVDAFVEGLILERWVLGGPSRWKMGRPRLATGSFSTDFDGIRLSAPSAWPQKRTFLESRVDAAHVMAKAFPS